MSNTISSIIAVLKEHGAMTREELFSHLGNREYSYQEVNGLLISGKIIYIKGNISLPEKKSKYNNIKTVVDNTKFDSKKEANYYSELKIMENVGLITDLVLQPKFEICPSVKWNGKKLAARRYIADFMYIENGKKIVVDVKGVRTSVYSLKRSLFLTQYPEYKFKEV